MTSDEYDRLARLGRWDMLEGVPIPVAVDELQQPEDMVNKPSHYMLGDAEEIITILEESGGRLDAMHIIKIVLGQEGWKAYCKGNMLKYLLRKKWDADEDVAKAGRYSEMYTGENI